MSKVTTIQPRITKTKVTQKNIMYFGADNLYPNNFLNVINSSPTAKIVTDIYTKFIFGMGFDLSVYKKKVNQKGLRLDNFFRKLLHDYSRFKGFAVHVSYDAQFEEVGFTPVPFEKLRLSIPDDNGNVNIIQYSDDWSDTRKYPIKNYNIYTKDKSIIARQIEIAGGLNKYSGTILYFGENGEIEYPLAFLDAVKDDMITEFAVAETKNSNVNTNFLASHIVEVPFSFEKMSTIEGDDDGEEYFAQFKTSLENLQGGKNAGKFMVLENTMTNPVTGESVEIKLHKVDIQNLDKIHEYTETSIMNNIRRQSGIPAILIEPVATGFSTEIMQSAYNYMNNLTYFERLVFEEFFTELFKDGGNYKIKPLNYI